MQTPSPPSPRDSATVSVREGRRERTASPKESRAAALHLRGPLHAGAPAGPKVRCSSRTAWSSVPPGSSGDPERYHHQKLHFPLSDNAHAGQGRECTLRPSVELRLEHDHVRSAKHTAHAPLRRTGSSHISRSLSCVGPILSFSPPIWGGPGPESSQEAGRTPGAGLEGRGVKLGPGPATPPHLPHCPSTLRPNPLSCAWGRTAVPSLLTRRVLACLSLQ